MTEKVESTFASLQLCPTNCTSCLASITMTITIGYIILALAVSTIIGMFAGIYPAFRAARLDPILALTHAT